MDPVELIVDSDGVRLDRFLSDHIPGLSRTQAQRLIAEGRVAVEGKVAKPALSLARGDHVYVELPPPVESSLLPEEIPLRIVYEDRDIVVVDKPAGMVVHPAPGHPHGTLVHALLARIPDLAGIGGVLRPGIVHRLDKGTSGLVVVAKNDAAHQFLVRQFKERTVHKLYIALLEGHLEPERGAIEAPIARHPHDRQRMAVVAGGREARTSYRVLRYFNGRYTLVEAVPETGRTHQIRVHFAAIGHPVVGDGLYGHPSHRLNRQFLHAARLSLRLPSTGEYMEFRSDLPTELKEFLDDLAREVEGGN